MYACMHACMHARAIETPSLVPRPFIYPLLVTCTLSVARRTRAWSNRCAKDRRVVRHYAPEYAQSTCLHVLDKTADWGWFWRLAGVFVGVTTVVRASDMALWTVSKNSTSLSTAVFTPTSISSEQITSAQNKPLS